ncbi:helix-turn-helix domain-containing protein [Agrococcus sp. Marseille-P2731]|uniref:helix-turn-helix domain-containing protein n=1 Tax=Agrococcus sp. Marseille-P2731 TaxID=1841862 RepID=UPI00093106A3|nr:helix-turn-helix transcriptional regulator [Agrococcus sp. Marseille-P2731]
MTVESRIGASLAALRRSAGVSAAELAQRAALPESIVHSIEQGAVVPSPELVARLTGILATSLRDADEAAVARDAHRPRSERSERPTLGRDTEGA